jgi:hypothetical protein
MTHRHLSKIGMYKKLLIFFSATTNSSVWTLFARLVTEIANFVSLNSKLASAVQQHEVETNGVTKVKNEAFQNMVQLLVTKAQKAWVWALDNNKTNLIEIFDVHSSDFNYISEEKALAKVKNVRDALNSNIAAMTSVQLTAADITAINNAITSFQNTLGTIGTAQSHKSGGAEAINDIIRAIDKSLSIIDSLIVNTYSASNPDMVKEYLLNRNIEKMPTHHSGATFHIKDAVTGEDIQGAVIALNGKTTTSDIDGIGEIIKVKPDNYNATIKMANYVDHNLKISIERGKVTEVEVLLKK